MKKLGIYETPNLWLDDKICGKLDITWTLWKSTKEKKKPVTHTQSKVSGVRPLKRDKKAKLKT